MQRWDACRAISSLTCKQFFFYLWDLYYLKNMFCYLELYSPNLCFILEAKEMFELGPIQTHHQNSIFYPFHPVVDKKWLKTPIFRCVWASFSQSASAPTPHPVPQLDLLLCAFSACLLLIFSLSGASLLFPFHLSRWCVSISCFLAQNLPSHIAGSPENMCAMAELLFGCLLLDLCFWTLNLFLF